MSRPRMIVLAAGQGTRLRPLTLDVPKCMVPLHGRPLIEWQLRTAATSGMTEVILVGGFKVDQLRKLDARLVENPDYATTNMVASLFCAEEFFDDGFVVAYGDIIYNPLVLERLLASPHDIAVVVDRQWRAYWAQRSANILDDAESLRLHDSGRIISIGQKVVDAAEIQGQYIGLVSIRCAGLAAMRELVADERAANGSPEPFRVKYWGVGNENWGCGGRMTGDRYAELFRQFSVYIRNFGETAPYLIACGPSGNDQEWTRKFLSVASRGTFGFDLHFYSDEELRMPPISFTPYVRHVTTDGIVV